MTRNQKAKERITISVEAYATTACNTVVPGTVQHSSAQHAELRILGALALSIGRGDRRFVLAVGGRHDERRSENAA